MNKPPDWDDGAGILATLPPIMQEGITAYVMKGRPPGGFLTAVVCNDLQGACMKADRVNQTIIPSYVSFFYNFTPSTCCGSEENMRFWIKTGGWEGMHPDG